MKDCPRCHGSGEIGWNDSPINDPQCAQEATCNVCHGEGVVMLEDALLEALRSEFAGWVEHHPNGGHFDWIVATTNVYSAIEGTARRVAELEAALKDAIEFADEGWAYASPYFVEKWDYKGQREKLQAAVKGEK